MNVTKFTRQQRFSVCCNTFLIYRYLCGMFRMIAYVVGWMNLLFNSERYFSKSHTFLPLDSQSPVQVSLDAQPSAKLSRIDAEGFLT